MLNITQTSKSLISKSAAIPTRCLEEAMENVDNAELSALVADIKRLELSGAWSTRLIELLKRARLIADAEAMMAKYEAA